MSVGLSCAWFVRYRPIEAGDHLGIFGTRFAFRAARRSKQDAYVKNDDRRPDSDDVGPHADANAQRDSEDLRFLLTSVPRSTLRRLTIGVARWIPEAGSATATRHDRDLLRGAADAGRKVEGA